MKTKGFSVVLIVIIMAVLAVLGVVVFSKLSKQSGSIRVTPQSAIETNGQERKFVALGASITKANNLSSSLVGDNPEYSFTTGTKIESVYLYLKNKGENLTPINLAESGANSQKVLQQQVPNAIDYHPKYVTVDATSDILEDATPAQLKKNLSEIVAKIKAEDTVILIGSYPNFPKIRSAPYPSCKEDKLRVGFDKLTQDKILVFNQAIKDIASQNNLVYVDIYDVLQPSDISEYDCVHPNIEGQKKIARAWIEALERGR